MGCDIHLYVEYRPKPDSPWLILRQHRCTYCDGDGLLDHDKECFMCEGKGLRRIMITAQDEVHSDTVDYEGGSLFVGRNYSCFGALCDGVRGEPGIFPARGTPADASPEYMVIAAAADGHSHSWLTASDLRAAMVHDAHEREWSLAEFMASVWAIVERIARAKGEDNVRIVFYFDN